MELQKLETPKFRSVTGRSVQSNDGSVRDCGRALKGSGVFVFLKLSLVRGDDLM